MKYEYDLANIQSQRYTKFNVIQSIPVRRGGASVNNFFVELYILRPTLIMHINVSLIDTFPKFPFSIVHTHPSDSHIFIYQNIPQATTI